MDPDVGTAFTAFTANTANTIMTSYRITAPFRRGAEVSPSHLQEIDFVRMGRLVDFGSECQTQNARLTIPITVEMPFPHQNIVYPVNAYIRLYHYRDATPTVQLISQHPLPARDMYVYG